MRRFPSWSWTLVLAVAAACSSSNPPVQTGKTIGQAGGTVTSSDGKVSLVFPAGALAQDTRIDIQPVTTPAENYLVPGTTYALSPDGTEFAKPVAATFHYDPAKLPSGADENRLQVATLRSDGQRLSAPSTVDTSAHTVAAQITGFSTHTVVCCIPPRTPTDFFGSYDAANSVIHLSWNLVLLGGLNPTSELRIERAEVILPLDSDYHPLTTLTEASPGFASGIDDPGSGLFRPNLPVWYRISGAAGIYVAAPVTTFVLLPQATGTLTLTATAASTTSILLSWNNIPDVISYQLERDSGAGFSVIAGPANTALQFTDTGLTPSTFYNYRLTANLSAGAMSVATAGATTLGSVVSSHIGDQFSSPRGITVDANARLVQTAIDGTNWSVTPLPLSSTGFPANPTSLAFAPSGALSVTGFHSGYLLEVMGGTTTLFTTEPHGDTFSRAFGVAVGP
jgi:hypothetical protein